MDNLLNCNESSDMISEGKVLVRIRQARSNLFLTLEKGTKEITQQAYLESKYQQWYLEQISGQLHRIQNLQTGEYMAVPQDAVRGSKLTTTTKTEGNFSGWLISGVNQLNYRVLINDAFRTLYMDNQGSDVPGTPIQVDRNRAVPELFLRQAFYFEKMDC